MKYSHRFFLYAPVAVVVALAVAAGTYWSISANAFSRRLDALNGHEVAPGVTFSFASKSISGFPFRIDAVLKDMSVNVATTHGEAGWRTENFALHMLDYRGEQFVFEAAGNQLVSWRDKYRVAHAIKFVPGLMRASAIAGDGRLKRVDLQLIGAAVPSLTVARTELHLRRDPNADALDVAFMADGVHLSPDLRTAWGDVISKIRLNALLTPAESWNALLSGTGDWRSAAEQWRTRSGTLTIAQLEIAWGKVNASGSGELRLDDSRRPQGLIKLQIANFHALADAAAGRHLIKGAQAGVLSGLMLEAASADRESAGRLPVTLAFKDGLAYVGQTPTGFLDPVY